MERSQTKPRVTRSARSAFTLVELLLVIVIIGMLMALLTAGVVRAIGTGRNAQITTEISLLDSAMQTYKNDSGGAYPPDFSLLTTPANNASGPTTPPTSPNDVQNRQNRILAHLRKAFPRLIIPAGYGPATTTGTLQYMSQQAFSQSTTYGTTFTGGIAPNGTSKFGDFDNLDPAEAMVFWLGGFAVPVPDPSGKILYKLIGFSANKVGNAMSSGPNANGPNAGFGPFNLDVTSRDMGPFEFNQGRLGDADGDGWPEYYPPNATVPQPPGSTVAVANPMPPYVYFDAISYGYYNTPTSDIGQTTWTSAPVYPLSAVYPSPLSTVAATVPAGSPGAQPLVYAATWGTAMPYCQTVSNSGAASITWANPQKYQIVSAGLDLMYWFDTTGLLAKNVLRAYPVGTNYSQGDLDNLTNFTTSTLLSAQP
jgi:prepilin-type N-terminal cleavage/methylation domain-containing protein